MLWPDNPNWRGESENVEAAAEEAAQEYATVHPCRVGIFSGAAIQQKILVSNSSGKATFWRARPITTFSVSQIFEPMED